MRLINLSCFVLLSACGQPSDDDLRQQAARDCAVSPNAITLWKVKRDPTTRRPVSIASAGVGRCIEDWKSRHGIMSTFY